MSFYRQVAVDNIERAVASANASSSIKHALLKGRLREVVIADLIRPFLMPNVKIATGTVVDHHGGQSSQMDIIIYDERVTAPVLMTPSEGFIPCHSVLATVEVKTRLSRTEVKRAVQNARSLKNLRYDYDSIPFSGELGYQKVFYSKLLESFANDILKEQIRHHLFDVSSPACFIFAFESDLSRSATISDEISRLKAEIDLANAAPGAQTVELPIAGLCVADKGFAACSGYNPLLSTAVFEVEAPSEKRRRGRRYWASHNVILKFESTILNTCAMHSHQRWRIPLDIYFRE